jgi:hypothetical protein
MDATEEKGKKLVTYIHFQALLLADMFLSHMKV